MFTFNFGETKSVVDENDQLNKTKLEWFPVSIINPLDQELTEGFANEDFFQKEIFPNVTFKLMRSDSIINKLKEENCNHILEAESHHSDLLPAKYEGGLKIWECTYDLGNYIIQQNYTFKDKLVLDLGCGAGILGLLATKNEANVHFQDYNMEVIKYITIPNVKINNEANVLAKCKFYSGDWESFNAILNEEENTEDKKYDYIFTSETIYNPENHNKLFNVFKNKLKKNGIGLIAAKTHYFGVGGGMRQFETLVKQDQNFDAEIIWNSNTGLKREILKITRRQS